MSTHLARAMVAGALVGFLGSPPAFGAPLTQTFATLKGCVYNKATGRPIQHALVFVQSLGGATGIGGTTGADGCASPMSVATQGFQGDYIEAAVTYQKRLYREQYRIPHTLLEQAYRYDFFVDAPREAELSEQPPLQNFPRSPVKK